MVEKILYIYIIKRWLKKFYIINAITIEEEESSFVIIFMSINENART